MTFAQLLLGLQGPLLNAAVGLLITFGIEYVPWFCALSQQHKRLAVGGLSLCLPLAACAVAVVLGYQPNDIDRSWFPAITAGFAAFASATIAHTRALRG